MTPSAISFLRLDLLVLALCGAALCGPDLAVAQNQKAVSIGGGTSVLIMPRKPRASIILMPGGRGSIAATTDGDITRSRRNQLVRTRMAYVQRGHAVLVLDASSSLAAAVTFMRKIKQPVTVAATSRGTLRAAYGIRSGARPDRLVLAAGMLSPESGGRQNVASILGTPTLLPPTLVLHHRQDACRVTLPAGVAPFQKWAGGRVRVIWLSGGHSAGRLCGARAHHGFNGIDDRVVGLAATFR